jgi:hypothetical protein
MKLLSRSLIDGNTYPFLLLSTPAPGLRVATPLIAIEALLLFVLTFGYVPCLLLF